MNTPIPLLEADVLRFMQNRSVVRLFQNERWYAGYVTHLTLADDTLGILIGPMIRFGNFIEAPETVDVTHRHLITRVDMPIKGTRIELSDQFRLPHPMRLDSKYRQEGVLHIESANGKVTISMHKEDITSVDMLFECEKTPIEKYDD
jgi:hypothetical protein